MSDAPGVALGRSFPELCMNAARRDGNQVAVVEGRGYCMSYNTLVTDAGALAGGLRSIGVGACDIVGLFAPNSTEWVVSPVGCHIAGCTVAPIHI